jgi:hypothetical protein
MVLFVDIETNAGNERVLVEVYDPSINSWDPVTYCNPTNGPGQEEYHVLVKAGKGRYCDSMQPNLLGYGNQY